MVGAGIGSLEDLDQADRFQVGLQQAEQQEELGGIGGRRVVARCCPTSPGPECGGTSMRLAAGESFVQQPAVLGLVLLALAETAFPGC